MDYKDHERGLKDNHFWFFRRTQFIGILLKKFIVGNNLKILNIGAGTGSNIYEIKKYGSVFVLDINQKSLDQIPNHLVTKKILADACSVPYKNNSFDLILAFDVLEHVNKDFQVINQVKRLLKPNGIFIFTVPAYNFLFSYHDQYLGHYRRYNKRSLERLLNPLKKIDLGSWFFCLLLPVAVCRLINKRKSYDSLMTSNRCNYLGKLILGMENFLFKKGVRYPLGLSYYGVYKK